MPLVRIPTPLRALTKGTAEVQAKGGSVAAVVDDLERQFPGLRERLVDEGGELRRFRSEEHTSELQSQSNLVCRLLLEKKKKTVNMVTAPRQQSRRAPR